VGTEVETVWPYLNPENALIWVVEDGARIVGAWTTIRMIHAECLWIAPEYRGSAGVARKLLKGLREMAAYWGVTKVQTASISEHVTDLILRFGGTRLPDAFILPAAKTQKTELTALGENFHRQLEAQITDNHPDDVEHDEHVGLALKTAINGDPETAMRQYNDWANSAGYGPIKYLGMFEGKIRADIGTAIVEVDNEYHISVVGG